MREFGRLLLIDDEPGIRLMMSLDLTADGYEVFTAGDGPSGLAVFERERPDIVLTDLKMQGMDGIELLRRIRGHSHPSEVIVITGCGDLDLAIQALQLDASDFVTKPVNDQALSVALARARERLRLKAELRRHTEELERRVRESAARLVHAERLAAVGQAATALGHSLKNMLSGLRGGAHLVRQGLEAGDRAVSEQGLAMVQRNLARAGRLTRDLLTLAKSRRPELRESSLNELCAEATHLMQAEAGDKEVRLTCSCAREPLTAQLDQQAVLDALVNLIGNAVDAAAEVEGGCVSVSASRRQEHVCLEVADNGAGLEPEAAARIFRGHYSSKGSAGNGLGLMVCQKVASEHGGRVEFDRAQGRGTVFRLSLPPGPAPDDADAPTGANAQGKGAAHG
jgi:C4-dicarboxylate-specific signal transduction histidine kinase